MNDNCRQHGDQKHDTDPNRYFLTFSNIVIGCCSSNAESYQRDDSDNENN